MLTNVNRPATFATPPVSVEVANVCPFITLVAVGTVMMVASGMVFMAVNTDAFEAIDVYPKPVGAPIPPSAELPHA